MQSMGTDASAFHQLFGAAGVPNPHALVARSDEAWCRACTGGRVQKIATARFPMAVVLAVQDYCLQRAQEATSYVVVNTMGFLRPSELPKCTLHGIWSHCHTDRLARGPTVPALPVSQYVGISLGEMAVTARGRRTIGAHTKVSRKGQTYDADLRGCVARMWSTSRKTDTPDVFIRSHVLFSATNTNNETNSERRKGKGWQGSRQRHRTAL
jgi:hypothetical protein